MLWTGVSVFQRQISLSFSVFSWLLITVCSLLGFLRNPPVLFAFFPSFVLRHMNKLKQGRFVPLCFQERGRL